MLTVPSGQRLRVLLLSNLYPPLANGGYEQVLAGTVAHLREQGAECLVLTTAVNLTGEPEVATPGVLRLLQPYQLFTEQPRANAEQALSLERHNQRLLTRQIADFDPQVIALWSMGGLPMSLIDLAAGARPCVAFVHEYWPVYGPARDPWLALPADHPAVRAGTADGLWHGRQRWAEIRWTYVSDFVRRAAVRAHGTELAGEVLSSGVRFDRFRPQQPRPWRGELLFAGRLDLRKGLLTAINCLAELPDCRLTVVGGELRPQDEPAVRAAAAPHLADGRLRLLGALPGDRLSEIFATADVVLAPSEWDEPWGLSGLETMAHFRPLVATGVGGAAEYLRDELNCLLVPPGDPSALAKAVRRLADDPALRRQLCQAGLRTAAQHTAVDFEAGATALLVEAARRAG